jgi:hypothetical protein
MPEEIEVPTEHLHEAMEEAAEESSFNSRAALSSALIAVFAAICALLAGGRANEAVMSQIKASDTWNYYQAKGIKAAVLSSKIDTLKALGKKADEKDLAKVEEYKKDQEEVKAEGDKLSKEAEELFASHEKLAKGVTFFQIAIAMSAIAVLSRKKPLWIAGILLGLVGIGFLVLGLI